MREFFETATKTLFAAYDTQKHLASITADTLEALDPRDTQSIDPLIRRATRATVVRLAERILEASPGAREPN